MSITVHAGPARRRRWAGLIAAAAAGFAAVLPAATPASATAYCHITFYWNNDGSPTWLSEPVASLGIYPCGSVPSITRFNNATQVTAPFFLGTSISGVTDWWNNDGSPNWTDDGFNSSPTVAASAAATAGGTEVAYVGTDGSVWFAWNTYPPANPNGWTLEKVAPAGSAVGTPAITTSTGGVEITASAPNGSLWFYWVVNGSSTWHPVQVAAANSTAGSPAIANLNGATDIAAEAPDGSVWLYWITDGTSTWHPEQVSGPGAAQVPATPALTLSSRVTEIAYPAPDRSLWFDWATNGTTYWVPEQAASPGSVAVSTSPAMTRSASATEIAATAPDGSLWFYWNNDGSSTWYSEQVAGTGGFSGASPAIIRSGGATEIAVVS
jgi:hypothetical protein